MRSDSLQDHASSAGAEGTGQRRSRRSTSRSRSRSRDRGRDRDRDRDRGREDSRDRGRARNGRESARAREERERADRSRYAGMTGAQIEREKAKKRLEELSRLRKDDYEEWKEKLRTLDLSRTRIKEAMGFAFDKIESADEVGVSCAVQRCKGVTYSVLLYGGITQIVSMVKDKLILPSSYAAVKIAGLYLLSDILHNTGAAVKHASTYRWVLNHLLFLLVLFSFRVILFNVHIMTCVITGASSRALYRRYWRTCRCSSTTPRAACPPSM
jgi:hypothetical protein